MRRCLPIFGAVALLLGAAACTSTHDQPPAAAPAASAQEITQEGDTLVIPGLIEYDKNLLFWEHAVATGTLRLSDDRISWRTDKKPKRDFSIQPDVVESLTARCVERAGGNLCLELVPRTATDLKYRFRDMEWSAGQNHRIKAVASSMRKHYPSVIYREEAVDEIK